MTLYLQNNIQKYFSNSPSCFDQVMALRGESFRHQKGRITQRVMLGEKSFFIKQHHGVGWKEIAKNILQGRLPVISAKNEWQAIYKLQSLDVSVPTIVGYGERGCNPARLQSFLLMEELTPTISLEDLAKHWQNEAPSFLLKCKLIEAVARIARILHENGMNHRDFYICHFLLDISQGLLHIDPYHIKLYLIDLHRVQIRRLTPRRWIIKDLSSLYFSSMDIGLTRRDLYRFMKAYRKKPLRVILATEKTFWQKVTHRGKQLYCDHFT